MVTRIVIDPGHGRSTGASFGDVFEDDIVLAIATKAQRFMRGLAGVEGPWLTRDDDRTLSLDDRGECSKRLNADLVISIHVNAPAASGDTATHGAFAFYWPGNPRGQLLARHIYAELPRQLRRSPARIEAATVTGWPRVRSVLKHHDATTVLIETGFITNRKDREFLASAEGQDLVAWSIVSGVENQLAFEQLHGAP